MLGSAGQSAEKLGFDEGYTDSADQFGEYFLLTAVEWTVCSGCLIPFSSVLGPRGVQAGSSFSGGLRSSRCLILFDAV